MVLNYKFASLTREYCAGNLVPRALFPGFWPPGDEVVSPGYIFAILTDKYEKRALDFAIYAISTSLSFFKSLNL